MNTGVVLGSIKPWLPAALIGLASAVALPLLGARPLDPVTAAGVFPPWWSGARSIAAAGAAGSILGVGAAPFIVIVRARRGDAQARLARAGALFSIDPRGGWVCGDWKPRDVQDHL